MSLKNSNFAFLALEQSDGITRILKELEQPLELSTPSFDLRGHVGFSGSMVPRRPRIGELNWVIGASLAVSAFGHELLHAPLPSEVDKPKPRMDIGRCIRTKLLARCRSSEFLIANAPKDTRHTLPDLPHRVPHLESGCFDPAQYGSIKRGESGAHRDKGSCVGKNNKIGFCAGFTAALGCRERGMNGGLNGISGSFSQGTRYGCDGGEVKTLAS